MYVINRHEKVNTDILALNLIKASKKLTLPGGILWKLIR